MSLRASGLNSLQDFITNNRGINEGEDIPHEAPWALF